MKENASTSTFCETNEMFFNDFFLEMVRKLKFVEIICKRDLTYHEEQIHAVIFICSKYLGNFRKRLKN
jgi:hypothetical protein